MEYWEAVAEYADGTCFKAYFPYNEDGNYTLENKRQFELESYLIARHDDCTFYSVNMVKED